MRLMRIYLGATVVLDSPSRPFQVHASPSFNAVLPVQRKLRETFAAGHPIPVPCPAQQAIFCYKISQLTKPATSFTSFNTRV